MCCLFTCCGWCVDMVQRVWVFVMSCCISAAICCVLMTSSMSGVALGYNYSLAEYIDTKETNVSVYIKRGVFDDDVSNDLVDMRRSGGQARRLAEDDNSGNVAQEVGPEEIPGQSGRRLEDSIMQSNDNSFEGSLMKLTMKPPYVSTTQGLLPDDSDMIPVMKAGFQADSIDQLKAIQGVINARKSGVVRQPLGQAAGSSVYNDVNSYIRASPNSPGNADAQRRMMSEMQARNQGPGLGSFGNGPSPVMPLPNINPARFAVPSEISRDVWEIPKVPIEEMRRADDTLFADTPATMPPPVTYRVVPIRPPTTKISPEHDSWRTSSQVSPAHPSLDKSLEHNLVEDKSDIEERFDDRSGGEDTRTKDFLEKLPGPKIVGQENNEYYDDELKGLPVRRRRNLVNNKSKQHQDNVKKAIPQKAIPGHLIKSTVGKSSNEIADYKSVLVSKLHFLDNPLSNETSSTNEKEVVKESVGVNNDTLVTDSSVGKALKIIQSMFS